MEYDQEMQETAGRALAYEKKRSRAACVRAFCMDGGRLPAGSGFDPAV
jgi:hypothetical protein